MCEKRCLLGYIVCSFLLSCWEIQVNVSRERATVQTLNHFIMLDSAEMCLYARDLFLFGENYQKCLEAVGLPLEVREICSYIGQAESSLSQPCHCPPHPQCCLISLKPEQSSWEQVWGRLEHRRAFAGKRDTHPLMDRAQSREKVKDKKILPRERGITVGPERDSSSPGTSLALGHVGLSPLAALQGTFPTMKVGEATDQLSASSLSMMRKCLHLPGLWGCRIPLLTQQGRLNPGDVTCAPAFRP